MLSTDFHNVLSCLKLLSFQWPLEFWGTARSRRKSKEPFEQQESGFSPKKSESSARNAMFRHFPYNENPTRTLNSTSLKCCLPSTDAIDRWEKIQTCI